jgi:glycosyltransferase involved in cell wall biosynthesis
MQEVGLPSGSYVLTVGSIEPRKNLHRLLAAWDIVARRRSDEVWLVVVGSKGVDRVFRSVELDRIPRRVHFAGYVDDARLAALLSGALLFAYLSEYEGFGFPPLEAMSAGIPTITGNRTSLPEVVGDAALTVDPFDVEAIADALERLLSDTALRADLARRGAQRAKQFTWSTCAAKTLDVLQWAARGG